MNSKNGYQCTCSAEFTGTDCEGKLYILPYLLTIMKHDKPYYVQNNFEVDVYFCPFFYSEVTLLR